MRHLFGIPEKPASMGYVLKEMSKACIRREFAVMAMHRVLEFFKERLLAA